MSAPPRRRRACAPGSDNHGRAGSANRQPPDPSLLWSRTEAGQPVPGSSWLLPFAAPPVGQRIVRWLTNGDGADLFLRGGNTPLPAGVSWSQSELLRRTSARATRPIGFVLDMF